MVDVSDLGILAANYGSGTGTALDFHEDARALGLIVGDNTVAAQSDEKSMTYNLDDCSSAGLTLATGVFLAVLSLLPHWTSRALIRSNPAMNKSPRDPQP